MPIFRVDVMICATAYLKAEDEQAARRMVSKVASQPLHVQNALNEPNDTPISGVMLDSADLPDLSLSPAMTIVGKWPDADVEDAAD